MFQATVPSQRQTNTDRVSFGMPTRMIQVTRATAKTPEATARAHGRVVGGCASSAGACRFLSPVAICAV